MANPKDFDFSSIQKPEKFDIFRCVVQINAQSNHFDTPISIGQLADIMSSVEKIYLFYNVELTIIGNVQKYYELHGRDITP